jgi:hypothetical protein
MRQLGFLSEIGSSPASLFQEIIEALINGEFTYAHPLLVPTQVHLIAATIKFVAGLPEEERVEALSSVGCPDAAAIAAQISAYAQYVLPNAPIHTLRDFDWSASLILGSSTISNSKEPLMTFRFDIDANESGKTVTKTRNIELTLEEAQQLLAQLEAARTAQRDLLQK